MLGFNDFSWMRVQAAALLAAALVAFAHRASASVMQRVLLEDQDAVCTDGSPAGYYWSAATTAAGNSTWLVYLEGGGWCFSATSCAERCGTPSAPKTGSSLCSSRAWGDTTSEEGLFAPASSGLADANKVFVRYCTSDGHMGNATQFGWQFRGGVVVASVIADVVRRHGLGSGVGGRQDLLVFGGGSAGARGAMVHLDYVPEMLGARAAAHVTVRGFLDSPLWLDEAPFRAGTTSLANTTVAVHGYAEVSHLGTRCAAANPGADGWRCLFGQYRMPLVRTPYLLVASQYDAFQLGWNVGHEPASAPEKAYAEAFAARTVALVRSLRAAWPASRQSPNAVYSWACYNHCTSLTGAGFNTDKCGPLATTMDAALQQTLALQPHDGSDFEWIDTCDGFACSTGCLGARA